MRGVDREHRQKAEHRQQDSEEGDDDAPLALRPAPEHANAQGHVVTFCGVVVKAVPARCSTRIVEEVLRFRNGPGTAILTSGTMKLKWKLVCTFKGRPGIGFTV